MKQLMSLSAAAALLALAWAEPAAEAAPCKTKGAPDAQELTFNLQDPQTLQGLEIAFQLGLMPKEFPESDIAAITDPCSRGPFPYVNGVTMDLRGEDENSPPRWAVSSLPGPLIYLALVPKPGPALKFTETARHGGEASFEEGDMMYVVALTLGDPHRQIFHFFDKIPDDEKLKAIFKPIAISQGRKLMTFDMNKGKVVVANE